MINKGLINGGLINGGLINGGLIGNGEDGGFPNPSELLFNLFSVKNDKYLDLVGQYTAPDGHDYQNAHLTGDGVTAIYFYAGLDGETVWLYNIGTSSWVSQTYNHATGIVLGVGVEILEAYTSLFDVYTFEEKGCAALYNLKGTDHGYVDATGVTLENFRAGRNNLPSQWGTAIRGKNTHAYGYSGSVGVTGATTGYRFTEPVPVDVDFTMTYGPLTSPIIYDYANTQSDGNGDGYGFRINTDYTADFYRKDAGVITVLASATAGDYEGGIRVVMNYNIANDKFTLKAYELGAVNPSDTDNVIDPTYAYPENDYQRFEFPNGNETVELLTDGTVEDLNLWTISGTVCVAYVASACVFDESLPPVITGFIYDEVGNRLDAIGGRLKFVGLIKFNAWFVNSNGLDISALSTTFDFATALSGGETLEYQGTAVLALSTTQITVTTIGTVYDLKVKSGSTVIHHYPCAEGDEDTLYDVVGSNKITLNNFNLDDWDSQDLFHYNMVNGFDLYTNTAGEYLYVPIGSTVTQTGWALLKSFPQDGKSLLPSETDIVFPQAPALIQADVDNVLFDVSGNPLEIDWSDVINSTAEQEVIGIESTVGTDGQGQVVVPGLTVQYQEYTADVPNGGTLVFSSVSGDDYYDSLNNVIVVGTGSDITLTNNTGDTADMGVIHMDGQLEGKTVAQMLALVQTMQPGTDLQHQQNPDVTSTHSDTIQKSIMSIRGTGGADLIQRSVPAVADLSIPYFGKNIQNVFPDIISSSDVKALTTTNPSYDIVRLNQLAFPNWINTAIAAGDRTLGSVTIPGYDEIPSDSAYVSGLAFTVRFSVNDSITFVVPKGTYASLAEAQADLNNKPILVQLLTPIITDAEITIVDENGVSQDYWHLYENGQISGEAEDLLPIVKYKNLQHGDQIMADTSRGYKKQRLVGYAVAQIGYALQQIYRALNK